jgi:hypothetical protein
MRSEAGRAGARHESEIIAGDAARVTHPGFAVVGVGMGAN